VRVLARSDDDLAEHITIDGRKGHLVSTSEGTIQARWLIDATGRSSPLVRKLNLARFKRDERHVTSSWWARYENCREIDELGNHEWRQRVKYNSRFSATNHFMYRGYWIWVIPLLATGIDRIDSIGVVTRDDITPMNIKNGEELLAFFRQHKAIDEILGPSPKALDFVGLKNLARCAKQFFSEDRWALTGMAGLIICPLGSTTCGAIAHANVLIGHLIRADLEGREADLKKMVRYFNYRMVALYENLLEVYGHYEYLGSYDVWSTWWSFVLSDFFNRRVPDAVHDRRALVERALADKDGPEYGVEHAIKEATSFLRAGSRLASEFLRFVDATGNYYAHNQNEWADSTVSLVDNRPELWKKMYDYPQDPVVLQREQYKTYRIAFQKFLTKMAEMRGISFTEEEFSKVFIENWESGQSLSDALNALTKN
jgi:flavin-dependent dehydrogenase